MKRERQKTGELGEGEGKRMQELEIKWQGKGMKRSGNKGKKGRDRKGLKSGKNEGIGWERWEIERETDIGVRI